MEAIHYKPLSQRTVDKQYRNLLDKILKYGNVENTTQGTKALSLFGHQMRFPLSNGVPIITERNVVSGESSIFYQALGELFGFLNGARTQKELESYGCRWWSSWVTERKCNKRGWKRETSDPVHTVRHGLRFQLWKAAVLIR